MSYSDAYLLNRSSVQKIAFVRSIESERSPFFDRFVNQLTTIKPNCQVG